MKDPTKDPAGDRGHDENRGSGPGRVEFPLLRQMMVERRFMWAVIIAALVCLTAGLGLPKIWKVTPPTFEPVVKISGLDVLQGWSLTRSARKAEAAGQWVEAVDIWQGAVANNPADREATRGLVEAVLRIPDPERRELGRGVQWAFWLMRLDGTNAANLSRVGRLCDKYGLDDLNLGLIAPYHEQLDLEARKSLLKAAYRNGQMDLFGGLWTRYGSGFQGDRELEVYFAAWSAGWGPVANASEGRARLQRFLSDPATAEIAHPVQLPLAATRQDLDAYSRSLAFLVDHHLDTLAHHSGYWSLLIQAGRSAEAAGFARKLNASPRSPTELIRVAGLLQVLGLRDEAIQMLERHLPAYSYNTQVWVALAEQLGAAGRWGEVRSLGLSLRNDPRQRLEVPGYGWFLEGYAAIMEVRKVGTMPEQELRKVGSLEFQEMVRALISDPLIGYRCAVQLQQIGRPEEARRLFEGLEKSFGGRADYWFRLGLAAYQTDDIRLMRTANEKAFQLNPEDPLVINNLAAALLMLREDPARAVELTLKRVAANPNDVAARINHLLALVLNRRTTEARRELVLLDPDALGSLESSLIHLARFEIAAQEGDRRTALAEIPRIERHFLKAAQAEWLDKEAARLSAAP